MLSNNSAEIMVSIHPINQETWLICGGRNFNNQYLFDRVMFELLALKGCPKRVIHGGATGADTMAKLWGNRLAIEVVGVAAQWKKYGREAGPFRNQKMLDDHQPDFVVAFPGGNGTADMVRRAKLQGIEVAEVMAKFARH